MGNVPLVREAHPPAHAYLVAPVPLEVLEGPESLLVLNFRVQLPVARPVEATRASGSHLLLDVLLHLHVPLGVERAEEVDLHHLSEIRRGVKGSVLMPGMAIVVGP